MQMIDDIFLLSPMELNRHISCLTSSQIEVMEQVVQGKNDKDIALLLSIKVDTVRRHIANARIRIVVNGRSQLIIIFALWKYSQAKPVQ